MWLTARMMSHCAHICHICLWCRPGGRHPCPSWLKDGDGSLVVTEQVDEVVHELRSPQFDSQCGIESLKVADERVVPGYPKWEGSMIGTAHYESSTAGHASIDV